MKAIGLHPSSTGKAGGQEIGDSVGHYIVPGGPFEVAAHELLMTGFAITWTEKAPEAAEPPVEGAEDPIRSRNGRQKRQASQEYACPPAGCNAWAKIRSHAALRRGRRPDGPRPTRKP